jgi:DNA-binding NtrC family response regulator
MITVLIVDDDPQLLCLLAEHVRVCGYQVLEARNADEAVGLLTSGTAPVDVVFTDVLMPGSMHGFGLARWLRQHHPSVRTLLTSGHTGWPADDGGLGHIPMLPKPYHLDELEEHLRRMTGVGSV